MRSSAAIGLVLLGSGVVATAVMQPKRCKDPVTEQPVACASGSTFTSSGSGHGGFRSSSGFVSSVGSVVRGGFGSFGAAMARGG